MRCLFSLCVLLGLLASGAWAASTAQPNLLVPHPAHFFILSESGQRYAKLRGALEVVGFAVQVGRYQTFLTTCATEHPALVVPSGEAERLTDEQQRAVLAELRDGRFLVLDGSSVLAAQLGAGGAARTAPLKCYRWSRHPTLSINLPEPTALPLLSAPAGSSVLADDPTSKAPLTIAGSAGKGKYLIDALPLEPAQYALYQYQPFLLEGITQTGDILPVLAGSDLGVYIDYGYHDSEEPEALAARLKLWGIRTISFSAWYDAHDYRVFLHRFLIAAHQRGMQVEAWLELPMVSIPFWKAHPEWRQRTAGGRQALVDWRYLMALENPQCLQAVTAYVSQIIDTHDWDGINLAEVYFESPGVGFDGPNFTPMNDLVRQQFRRRYGVDPRELFDEKSPHFWQKDARLHQAMTEYRVQTVTRLHRQLLDMCRRCQARAPGLHLTVTQIDTLLLPSMREQIGVDIPQLLALRQRYGFDIQLEDPYTLWNLGPERFRVIGDLYRRRLPAGTPLAIDINVVDRVPDPGQILVTERQHGLELYGLVSACAEHADTVYFYAANSLETPDMRFAPCAAAHAKLTPLPDGQLRYSSARQLSWLVDTRAHAAYLDNHPWPCLADDRVLLPAGTHIISLRPAPPAPLRVESLNAALLNARQQPDGCTIHYNSQGRCYLSLSRAARTIRLDGQPWHGQPVDGAAHALYVLPGGEHAVAFSNQS